MNDQRLYIVFSLPGRKVKSKPLLSILTSSKWPSVNKSTGLWGLGIRTVRSTGGQHTHQCLLKRYTVTLKILSLIVKELNHYQFYDVV